jgi:hypothetical protein
MGDLRLLALVGLTAAACSGTPRVCPDGFSADGKPRPGSEVWCRASGPTRARWIELHQGGFARKQVCPYLDGKAHGRYEAWHRSGNVFAIGDYAFGRKVGHWSERKDDGLVIAEGDYDAGRLIAGAPVGMVAHCEEMKP